MALALNNPRRVKYLTPKETKFLKKSFIFNYKSFWD